MNKKPGAIVLEGHVQGLSNTRSLGELGIPVYVLDVVHCLAEYSKYCSKFCLCPQFHTEEFIAFLLDLAKTEQLDGWLLVPSNDHIVTNLSLHKKELSVYFKMMVPDKSRLYDIINKRDLLKLAFENGVPAPKTCYYDNYEEANYFRFPVLVKGNKGLDFYKKTHLKAIQVNTFLELRQVFSQMNDEIKENVMVQEMIPTSDRSRAVSFTCFAIDGEIKAFWIGRKIREHPIMFGTATMSESVSMDFLLQRATPLLMALHYSGTCEIEFMFDCRDGQYKLIEINPRTWLWVGLAKECGVDYAKMMYRFVNNIEQQYPDSYEVGVKWYNAITDFVFGIQAIFKGKVSVKEYMQSLSGHKVHAIWSWNDLKPGLIFPFMLFYIAKKRG